jgi:type III pantothenate kinase
MLFAIDIGNTNITLGVWDGQAWRREWRLHTAPERTADEYGITLASLLTQAMLERSVKRVILSSVVPSLTSTFIQLSETYLRIPPVIINHQTDTGIRILTDNPQEVGADRIVNSAAAYHVVQGPCIVVDMGTATTFDVVSASGDLLGVAIAPGLRVAADALISRAAQLSQVPLEAPRQAIGRNTIHAVQSGLVLGYACLVEGMVARLIAEHPDHAQKISVIGTGGLIGLIAPYVPAIDIVDPWLTLLGLRVINDHLARSEG